MRIADKIIKLLAKPKKGKICLCMLFTLLLLTSCGATNETIATSSDNEYETISTYESNEINNPIEQESIETVESEIDNTTEETIEPPEDKIVESAELQVHFIDVGQEDSTLIICDSEAMLIDAGDNNQGTKVQNYFQKQGIETLKYVICTHPDADHIGGIDVILYKFDCETIFMTEEKKDTNTYRDVIDTIKS